ncbi:MAG: hypothetical protein IPK50_05105 [Fibrobacterota bacterium]|nr:MAG: hypothetical protein IPK50_05105 [Fibrobacterota bacterium]
MIQSDSPQVPTQDLVSIADAIRKIHELCEKRERQVAETTIAQPNRLRWLKVPYGLAAMVAFVGYLVILSQVHWQTAGWLKFHMGAMWSIFVVLVTYTAAASLVWARNGWKEIRESASAFSREDGKNVERELRSDVELARFDPSVLQLVSSWLENQAKRIENRLNWFKGSAGMVAALLAATFIDKSPLRVELIHLFGFPGFITVQILAFSGLLGTLVGMVVVGKCAANSSNRALHLRRILAERNTLLGIANVDGGGGTTSGPSTQA